MKLTFKIYNNSASSSFQYVEIDDNTLQILDANNYCSDIYKIYCLKQINIDLHWFMPKDIYYTWSFNKNKFKYICIVNMANHSCIIFSATISLLNKFKDIFRFYLTPENVIKPQIAIGKLPASNLLTNFNIDTVLLNLYHSVIRNVD